MHFITKKSIKIPKRKAESHKGDNGRVLCVGGSVDYAGAIALAGIAALRSGADITVVAAPEKAAWVVNSLSADLMTRKFKGEYFTAKHADDVLKLSRNFDVVLIGNGLGIRKETKAFCKKIIQNVKGYNVIDADAIKAISANDAENSILTPHAKELDIFMRNSGKSGLIKKLNAEKNIKAKARIIQKELREFLGRNNIILLKGHVDTVISKNKIAFNKTGNAGMTKGGTGDVLAGLCAGYLAQSRDLWQSAVNAAYINGMIGDILLKKKKGFTYLASDMVEEMKRIKS